jgi:competence protein ComQ
VVEEKSASLVGLALYSGLNDLDNKNPLIERQLLELSKYIGIVAQLKNDASDLLRFDLKNDILQKKKTLSTLFLLDECKNSFPLLKEYYDDNITREELLHHKHELLQVILDSGVLEYTIAVQNLYLHKAERLLKSIPIQSPWIRRFKEITIDPFRN